MQVRVIQYPYSIKKDDLILVEREGGIYLMLVNRFETTNNGYPGVILDYTDGLNRDSEQFKLRDLLDSKRFMLVINEKSKTKEEQNK